MHINSDIIEIKDSIYFFFENINIILLSGRNFKLATPLLYVMTYGCIHIFSDTPGMSIQAAFTVYIYIILNDGKSAILNGIGLTN